VASHFFGGTKIKYVSAHTLRSVAVDTKGQLYVWGEHCMLSLKTNKLTNITVPNHISQGDFNSEKIHTASAGWMHFMALTVNGNLFSWGYGPEGQLGEDDDEDDALPLPTQVNFDTRHRFVQVACGKEHTLALTDGGLMYTWGCGTTSKHEVKLPEASRIVYIAVGDKISAACDEDGRLFIWKIRERGRLRVSRMNALSDTVFVKNTDKKRKYDRMSLQFMRSLFV
jgi:alpha-tubulin suppressor-like RCC1 family protein